MKGSTAKFVSYDLRPAKQKNHLPWKPMPTPTLTGGGGGGASYTTTGAGV